MNVNGRWKHTSIWLLLVLTAAIWLSQTIKVNTDLTRFLPSDDSDVAEIINHQLNNGPASKNLFILLSGPADQLVEKSHELSTILRSGGLFSFVNNGNSLISDEDRKWIFDNRYLLSDRLNSSSFSSEGITASLNERYRELRSPIPAMPRRYLPADPTAEFMYIVESWVGNGEVTKSNGILVSRNKKTAIIIAQTKTPGWDVKSQEAVIASIDESFSRINDKNSLQLEISGTGYFSVYSKRHIESEAQLFSILASVALALFILVVYRSFRYVLLSAIPLASAVVAGTVAVMVVFTHIHGITLAFGITILGITIDYPIHVFTHANNRQKNFWKTMFTGAITTVIAFAVFFYTDIGGLAELGLFTLSGLLAAVLVTRWIIPLWLNQSTQSYGFRSAYSTSPRTKTLILLVLVITTLFTFSTHKIQWQDNLTVLSPLPKELLDRRNWIFSQLGSFADNRYIVTLEGQSIDEVLHNSKALEGVLREELQSGNIQFYETPSRYLPGIGQQKQNLSSIPSSQVIEANLEKSLADLPFKAGLFRPFVNDLTSTINRPKITYDQLSVKLLKNKIDNLVFAQGDHWTAIIPLFGLVDRNRLQTNLSSQKSSVNARLIDMKSHTNSMVRSFRINAGSRILIGLALMVVALLIAVRDLPRLARILLSLSLALATTLSALVLLEIKLSLFHLISLLLVMGIGLDYALFFSLNNNHHGHSSTSSRATTLTAITVCAVSTITVFGILALSDLYVLKAIGMTTTLGVASAYLMTWIFAQPSTNKA